ncbi:SPOR domain-containing protein [Reinekea thalattae]|uniref:AAA family ATPase n=1 Tax=Reinekea thalattae TaxID=2593301 RepID=A0A5C8Z146_9GAMM|nr:AAA family ATPase [Reinekea thalattae]TXR51872.1 AAA family ATPase [Reinekea thalattae]
MDLTEQSDRMQQHYNLRHDPFGPLVDALVFSGAGGRYDVAETVRHLLSYSPQEILLYGASGSGKRTLAQNVLRKLDDDWRVAWVDGIDTETVHALVKEIIGQLGLGLRGDQDPEALLPQIAQQASARAQSDEMFVIVVQFADHLSAEVTQALLELRDLCADSEFRIRQLWLAESLTSFPDGVNEDDFYIYELAPLDDDDAAQYLKDRLVAAGGVDTFPFTNKDVARLNQMSAGLPAALNDIARDFLIGTTFKASEKKRSFPITHIIAGVAALCLVVIAVLYNASISGLDAESEQVELADQGEVVGLSTIEEKLANAVANVESKQSPTEAEPADQMQEDDAQSTVAEDSGTVAPSVSVPEVSAATDSVAATNNASEAQAEVSQRLVDVATDSEYTLQLIGVRNAEQLNTIKEGLANSERYDIVATRYKGEPWYILIHGRYPSTTAAKADIATLPEPFRSSQPWARSFRSIRADLL